MRPLFVLFCFLLLTTAHYGQNKSPSKAETEQWICMKIKQYSSGVDSIFFRNGNLTTVEEIVENYFEQNVVPVKSITDINFEKSVFPGYITMLITSNSESDRRTEYSYSNRGVKEVDHVGYFETFNIELSEDMDHDNLKKRLKAAFAHLIKLNGGKLLADVF